MRKIPTWCRWLAALVAACVLPISPVVGQDTQALAELKALHDKLVRVRGPIPAADGQEAIAKLKEWKLPLDRLDREQQGLLARLEISAALAIGQPMRAARWLPVLEAEFAGERDTLRAAWLVAGAMGDAELAKTTLKQLEAKQLVKGEALAKRLERLSLIGQPAPDREVRTDEGQTIRLRARKGAVLVVDFWRLDAKPSQKLAAALRDLRKSYAGEPLVEWLGVNTDEPEKLAAARRHAADNGYGWAQYFEQPSDGASPLHEAMKIPSTPVQLVVDMDGNVRAAGTVRDPAFQYAVRAAVAEARGEIRAVRPKTVDGREARRPTVKSDEPVVRVKPKTKTKAKAAEQPVVKKDLPHNPEAQRLLDQARLFRKTGKRKDAKRLLEEIIEKYPGTWEAHEAKEMLPYV